MFILFGWGHKTFKNYGEAEMHKCDRCGHDRDWELYVVKTWFTLFFIPVIPYSVERFISCPICNNFTMLDKDEFLIYEYMTLIKEEYGKSRISQEEYEAKMNELKDLLKT